MDDPIPLAVGLSRWGVRVPADRLVALSRQRPEPAAGTPADILAAALEHPVGLNAPIRRVFTPDDRVAVVVDESLPRLGELVAAFLERLTAARIDPRNVSLLVAQAGPQHWLDDLPDDYGDAKVEVHQPDDRDRLAYLANTAGGRRVYLNRTIVDADVVVVLSGRRYEATFGYAGAEAALYPAFADEEGRAKPPVAKKRVSAKTRRHAARAESFEVLNLLGSTVLLQVIEGEGDMVAAAVAGLAPSSAAGIALQNRHWRVRAAEPADLAILPVGGDPARIGFGDLARALTVGKRLLNPGGRLALLTEAAPSLDDGGPTLRNSGTPASAYKRLQRVEAGDTAASRTWANAAHGTHLFVISGWPDDLAEDLFATAIHTPGELQRLADAAGRVVILPDAHKMSAALAEGTESP